MPAPAWAVGGPCSFGYLLPEDSSAGKGERASSSVVQQRHDRRAAEEPFAAVWSRRRATNHQRYLDAREEARTDLGLSDCEVVLEV